MDRAPKTINVSPGSELDRLLEEAGDTPLLLERDGVRYRVHREGTDIWAGYDPEAARSGMRAAAGSWHDADADELKNLIYRGREAGTRTLHRP